MPVIIWINGGFGASKTTLAQELHRRLPDAIVYDPEDVTCASRCLRGRSPQLVTHVGVKATSENRKWPLSCDFLVGVAGFEPAASSSRTEHSAGQVSWSAPFRHVRRIRAEHNRCV